MGCHSLLQGIFPAQGLNLGLPHCRHTLYRLSYQASPKSLGQATLTATSDCGYGCDTLCSLDINASYFDVDEIEAQTIILFPNPTQGQVTIQAPQLRHVKFYNMNGVVCKDLSFELPDMVNIDINDLGQGFYIVEIVTVQGKTSKKLFVLE